MRKSIVALVVAAALGAGPAGVAAAQDARYRLIDTELKLERGLEPSHELLVEHVEARTFEEVLLFELPEPELEQAGDPRHVLPPEAHPSASDQLALEDIVTMTLFRF